MRGLPLALGLCAVLLGASAAQPQEHPDHSEEVRIDYSVGLRKIKYKKWEAAARLMKEAHGKRPEDGELIRIYGNWFEPYLPEFYLGVAVFHVGCYEAARDLLGQSVLGHEDLRKAGDELELLDDLVGRAEDLIQVGITQKTLDLICDQWAAESTAPDPDLAETPPPL